MKYNTMNQLNEQYIGFIQENFEENRKTAELSLSYLKNSTARYHGETVYSLYMPKLFTKEAAVYFEEIVNTMYSIFTKVIERYLTEEEYRKLFGFEKELEELILIPRGYKSLLPIARVDIFLNEEDLSFQFCEFNADGTSSMNEDRELNIALTKTDVYNKMAELYEIKTYELFDSWAREFMDIYKTYEKKVEKPYIAIVDFLEKGSSMEEFGQFAKSFESLGYQTEICEIRDLKYENHGLYSATGHRIDVIYRRAVTCDIMHNIDSVEDFLCAVKHQEVCLIGSFCTQVIHNKILFKLLHEEATARMLNQKEREFVKAHIPYTGILSSGHVAEYKVLEEKNKWIIKPEDSYGAKGVYAGINFNREEWEKLVKEHKDTDYLVQEFCHPYQTHNIDFQKKEPKFKPFSNLTGLYVYNGKFSGIYSRQSKKEIISTLYDENVVASVVLD